MAKIDRALTISDIANAKVERYDFTGDWLDAFGRPQRSGVWFVCGNSGHGKTSFILQLIKYLATFDTILFESYEEGKISGALQDGIKRFGLEQAQKNVRVCDDSLSDLELRLKKRKSPDVIFLDSLEYSEFRNLKHIVTFTKQFKHKLFIVIGQAEGAKPKSKLGQDLLFHANQKIWVEGYRAICRGRSYGEKGYFTIWDKGAQDYWSYK